MFHPDVFAAMDAAGNDCSKAVWYDFLLSEVAINTTRDKVKHDQRRRIWDHGFTMKGFLLRYTTHLLVGKLTAFSHCPVRRANPFLRARLETHIAQCAVSGESVDVSSWFYWFSFDVMGDLHSQGLLICCVMKNGIMPL